MSVTSEQELQEGREKEGGIRRGMKPSETASMSKPELFAKNYVAAIFSDCHSIAEWHTMWLFVDTFILITGVVANVALLWLFMKERKALSASQVLGVNLVAMDLLYMCLKPVSLIYNTMSVSTNNSATAWQQLNPPPPPPLDRATDVFSMFNLIGCPLLLACMCIERYLAVVRPVLYLKVKKWEYRMAVSAVVWAITLSFCLAAGIVNDKLIILMPVSTIISCLFLLMLACLGSVVWSLQQQSPAHTTSGNQAPSASPLKRRAVANVLAVVVPAVIAYLPVLLMLPIILCVLWGQINLGQCKPSKSPDSPMFTSVSSKLMMTAMAASSLLKLLRPGTKSKAILLTAAELSDAALLAPSAVLESHWDWDELPDASSRLDACNKS
ncbi:hypothetical protein FQN60_005485, partial [Etheostoma spectabile]